MPPDAFTNVFARGRHSTVMHVIFTALRTYAIPFDALNEADPPSYGVHIWYGKTRMAVLQFGESRMMIDSVVLAQ